MLQRQGPSKLPQRKVRSSTDSNGKNDEHKWIDYDWEAWIESNDEEEADDEVLNLDNWDHLYTNDDIMDT